MAVARQQTDSNNAKLQQAVSNPGDAILQALDGMSQHTKYFRKAMEQYVANKAMLEQVTMMKNLQDQMTGRGSQPSPTGTLAGDAVANNAHAIQANQLLNALGGKGMQVPQQGQLLPPSSGR